MGKSIVMALAVATVAAFAVLVPAASADRAETTLGKGCTVFDANGNSWDDPDCTTETVIKLNADGSVAFVQYQDKGHLPPGAAFPKTAMKGTTFVDDGDGPLTGNYEYVITPSGQVSSKGPY